MEEDQRLLVKFPRRLTAASRYNSWRTDRQPKWYVPTKPPRTRRNVYATSSSSILLYIDRDVKSLRPVSLLIIHLLFLRYFFVINYSIESISPNKKQQRRAYFPFHCAPNKCLFLFHDNFFNNL